MDAASRDLKTHGNGSVKPAISPSLQQALADDQARWANGPVSSDDFYVAPCGSESAPPSQLLKLEGRTDLSRYDLPPGLSLSRFVYQSENFKGAPVPVSAYVLWPSDADEGKGEGEGRQMVVLWTHGTSGIAPDSAPSHYANLYFGYSGPFTLALHGYVVVATDYAGLGVSKTASGKHITHEYNCFPSHANDALHALRAARQAFPRLGKRFVVAGHSSGGAAAWSAAQRQISQPVDGYLGAVAISPITDILRIVEPVRSWSIGGSIPALKSIYPQFDPREILTQTGTERVNIIEPVGGNTAVFLGILSQGNATLFRTGYTENLSVQEFSKTVESGRREFIGPLLVIHAEGDRLLRAAVTAEAVEDTRRMHPGAQLNYVQLPGSSHDSTVLDSKSVWAGWIADRFNGSSSSSARQDPSDKDGRKIGLSLEKSEGGFRRAKSQL